MEERHSQATISDERTRGAKWIFRLRRHDNLCLQGYNNNNVGDAMRLIAGLIAVLVVCGQSAFAADGGRFYFNKDRASASTLAETQSRYQIEYEIYQREKLEEPWQKNGEGKLCFSSQPVENCHKWVGGLLMQLVLPSDPSGTPMWHTWSFGIGFSEPDQSYKTVVNSTATYMGVREVLEYFHAKPKVVLTNKRTRFMNPILDGLDLRRYFSATFGAECLPVRKPDPQTIHEICRLQGVPVRDAMIIGDTETDIATGKAAGCYTCAVSYGYGDKDGMRRLGPDVFVDDLREKKTADGSSV